MHLTTENYGNRGGGGNNSTNSSANIIIKKPGAMKGSQPQSAPRSKATWHHHKPALKTKGNYLKNKEKSPRKEGPL